MRRLLSIALLLAPMAFMPVGMAPFAAAPAKVEAAKKLSEVEIRTRLALAQEMIARRSLEIREIQREAADLARQLEEIEKKKAAQRPAQKTK